MIFVWPLAKIIIVIESISVSVFLIGTFSFCMNVLIHFDCFLCLWPPSHPACKELFDLIYLKPKALLLSYYFLSGDPECFCRCRVSAGDCPLSESMMTRAPVDALFLTPVQGRPSSLGLPAFCPLTEPRRPSPQCLSELYIIVSFSWASCFLPPLHVCTSFRFCLFQLTFPFFLFSFLVWHSRLYFWIWYALPLCPFTLRHVSFTSMSAAGSLMSRTVSRVFLHDTWCHTGHTGGHVMG